MRKFEAYMKEAILEAKKAHFCGEVPIGAVIVKEDRIISKGYNKVETLGEQLAHAEMIAIKTASRKLHNWRLDGAILVVTVEPCLMCLGAILNCRIGTVVYGASQQKQGAFSAYGLAPKKLKVISGIEKKQIEKLMKSFFKSIRSKNKK